MVTFKYIFDIPLFNNLFISYLTIFISLIKKHPLKKHMCNSKKSKITYSKL